MCEAESMILQLLLMEGRVIHNSANIIDGEKPIYNVPRIIDRNVGE
jgi:hypothetical protein